MSDEQRFCATCDRWMVRTEWRGNMAGKGYHPCSLQYPTDGDRAFRAPTYRCDHWKAVAKDIFTLPQWCKDGIAWAEEEAAKQAPGLEASREFNRQCRAASSKKTATELQHTALVQDYHAPRGCCGSCGFFFNTEHRMWCLWEYSPAYEKVGAARLLEEATDDCNFWKPKDGWKDTGLGNEPKEVLETEVAAEKPLPNYCVNCTAWEPIPTESGICTEKGGMVTGRSHECDFGYRPKKENDKEQS